MVSRGPGPAASRPLTPPTPPPHHHHHKKFLFTRVVAERQAKASWCHPEASLPTLCVIGAKIKDFNPAALNFPGDRIGHQVAPPQRFLLAFAETEARFSDAAVGSRVFY